MEGVGTWYWWVAVAVVALAIYLAIRIVRISREKADRFFSVGTFDD